MGYAPVTDGLSPVQLSSVVARDDGEDALVALARQGDRDAFARLIGPRTDRVLRTARAILGNEAEAHDAAQTALLSAWVHLPGLRDVDRFDVWINRILRNACRFLRPNGPRRKPV